MNRHLLLGLAGHIDHGKTALIKSLTGTDTDRLPEEKRRGLTVDLGFAVLEAEGFTFGIVDVPGHEALIKNMLAGATGIDLAMLVVAADEGVMPQTREHFQVLRLLGLSAGVVAITKCDLVDADWIDAVEEEIGELTANSFLQRAPVIRISAKTGEGLPQLTDALKDVAGSIPPQDTRGAFRLDIDRCFSSPGHGTVVTGSVCSGQVAVGDKLELLPQRVQVQVRSLESHSQRVDSVGKGQRAALNLTGVHYRDVERGQTLASEGSLQPSTLVSVAIELTVEKLLGKKSQLDVKFYLGTSEVIGKLKVLMSAEDEDRFTHYGQIELNERVCAVWQQPFVLRTVSENVLLGGGWIVDPTAYRIKRSDTERVRRLKQLADQSERQRVEAFVALAGTRDWEEQKFVAATGVRNGQASLDRLVSEGTLVVFDCDGTQRFLHRDVVASIEERLLAKLLELHAAKPLQAWFSLGALQNSFASLEPPALLDAIAAGLVGQGRLTTGSQGFAHPEWRGGLSARQTEVSVALIAQCQASAFAPPTVGEFAEQFEMKEDEVESLLGLAADSGVLVQLPDKRSRDRIAARRGRIYLHRDAEKDLRERIHQLWSADESWTVSQFREALGVSRKYAIPLCSYLDQIGITLRVGDRRQLKAVEASVE